MLMWKRATPFIAIVLVLLLLVFVWPTMYRYDKMDQKWPVRINRVTGKTEILYSDGWQDVKANQQLQSNSTSTYEISKMVDIKTKEIDLKEIKLTNLNFQNGKLTGEIKNVSDKNITLSSEEYQVFDIMGGVLPQQPLIDVLYSKLKPNESTVFSQFIGTDTVKYKIKLSFVVQ